MESPAAALADTGVPRSPWFPALRWNRLCRWRVLFGRPRSFQVRRVPEEAGSAFPGHFLGNAETNQVVQGHRHRWNG
jgi:hypothetical protein